MSKQIRLRAAALLVIFSMIAMIASFTPATVTAQSQSTVVAPTNAKSAAVVAATAAVLRETSEIRQLSILRQVKSGAQSRPEIERMIIKNMDEDTTPEELRASELALKKLGLLPPDFQLRPFIIKLLTEQVAGYYNPKAQEFYLADWIDVDGQKPVIAHELTHALQDQHFNLRRFENWPKGDSDAELAAHALIEGDATLAMMEYIKRNPLRALAFLKSMTSSAGGSSEQIERAPRALRESLLFPYQEGLSWVGQLYQRNGWSGVSQAFKDLPQSSEQILHPEKYFVHEAPLKVNLPDVRPLLGAGWKRIDYDVNGEWGYYLILDEYLQAAAESQRAAAGWGGDRCAVYEETKTGDVLMTHLSAWDTEADAVEFFEAYAKRTGLRYSNAQLMAVSKTLDTQRLWRTNEGSVLMERRGSRVLIVEGAPAKIDANSLMKTLWQ